MLSAGFGSTVAVALAVGHVIAFVLWLIGW
jgi:hypothetical protein